MCRLSLLFCGQGFLLQIKLYNLSHINLPNNEWVTSALWRCFLQVWVIFYDSQGLHKYTVLSLFSNSISTLNYVHFLKFLFWILVIYTLLSLCPSTFLCWGNVVVFSFWKLRHIYKKNDMRSNLLQPSTNLLVKIRNNVGINWPLVAKECYNLDIKLK